MLTHHRLINHRWVFIITIEISVNSHPSHFVMTEYLIFTDNWYIILSNTCYLTSSTSDTCTHINM